MNIPAGLFWVWIGFTALATVVAFAAGKIALKGYLLRGRLLWIDGGHDLLHASSFQARLHVVEALSHFGLMQPNYTFYPGGTAQTMLENNHTVVISVEPVPGLEDWPVSGRSFVVKDGEPSEVAKDMVVWLRNHGYEADWAIVPNGNERLPNSLVTIRTSALVHDGIHLRRHGKDMGAMNIVERYR